jgi:NodT family efflux transporter outer membrane factor (OMF) lipoprotein
MRLRSAAPLLVPLLAAGLLAGCNLAPPYAAPTITAPPPVYRDVGPWTPASPADAAPRDHWWSVIDDPQLDALEDRLDHDSPTLAAALARYDQATAMVKRAKASLYPEIDAGAAASKPSNPGLQYPYMLGGSLSYEVDLWGRVRNMIAASKAEARATAADAASIRLSLQAEVAEDYLEMRGMDALIDVLAKTTDDYKQALDLTQQRYGGGASSELDVSQAKTQLGDVQAQYEQAVASRGLLEHAIAALVGEQASTFSIAPVATQAPAPRVPVEAPSRLLQRRPDIAAAERRVAEANANIGIYRAALYPTIMLGSSAGYEQVTGLLNETTDYWAAGPASATMPLFDGGRRHADVTRARAAFKEAAAFYRQTVLDSFRQVEDELILTNRLATAEARQQEALDAAVTSEQIATRLYTEGATDYLTVVTAQTAELAARQADVQIRTQRLVASIDLVRALGGGWTTSMMSDAQMKKAERAPVGPS